MKTFQTFHAPFASHLSTNVIGPTALQIGCLLAGKCQTKFSVAVVAYALLTAVSRVLGVNQAFVDPSQEL